MAWSCHQSEALGLCWPSGAKKKVPQFQALAEVEDSDGAARKKAQTKALLEGTLGAMGFEGPAALLELIALKCSDSDIERLQTLCKAVGGEDARDVPPLTDPEPNKPTSKGGGRQQLKEAEGRPPRAREAQDIGMMDVSTDS